MELLIPTLAFFAGMSIGGYIIWCVMRGIPNVPIHAYREVTITSGPTIPTVTIEKIITPTKGDKVNMVYHPIDPHD